ncbi:alpha/beta hydrolase [Burkholderia cenocepacia]|nr:alpha/beta hydrolase [Burkholderia cenocepacia]
MSTFLYGGNVQANGIRQHFLRYGGQSEARGERDAVVIIPGITSPAVTWAFVGERFGRSFDTYVLDVRGRGLSEAGPSLDYSLDAQAADLVAFCEALGLKRFSWVGHSMGARIAVRAASFTPEGLSRMVLVDPPVSGPGRRAYPAKLAWYVDSIRLSRRGMSVEEMREFCPTWTEEQLSVRAEWLHTCDERAVVTSFEGFHVDDIHSSLPSIQQKVLLMTAERGDVVHDADVAEIDAIVSGLEHVRVKDAGHMIPWDNEEGFYKAFGDFLGHPLV